MVGDSLDGPSCYLLCSGGLRSFLKGAQLNLKLHLSGVAIAYEPGSKNLTPSLLPKLASRPNGSLYNRQKRKIADATEWMRLHQTKEQKAMIFCLTSPGFVSLANTPRFISRWINNMKTNYGLSDYVWVREFTKRGFPHFHFIAHWQNPQWFFACSECGGKMKGKECVACYCKTSRVNQLSVYWSGLFGVDSQNSIRLGSFHPVTKRRSYYVTHPKQCHYLTKYIGKNIGESFDYLGEAGFPSVKYKKTVRSFGMSENVGMYSEPQLFESSYSHASERTVMRADGSYVTIPVMAERNFIPKESNKNGCTPDYQLADSALTDYRWKWTGHGQTFIGYKKKAV